MVIVLASASPRRSDLLPALGVTFEVIPANVDESDGDRDATRLARTHAARRVRSPIHAPATS